MFCYVVTTLTVRVLISQNMYVARLLAVCLLAQIFIIIIIIIII